ncbi:hypothetical protein QTH90_05375 [Variovorax sp. J2P1-59]|uniref:hypothetical protein n=1 Tax=Variovorax flavidus TaxID=3053501 RepID=UPI002577A17F|nr:hypothetical protein [Variovorax sp. J2P1-59]MDM0073800.1 hypothetical protein [Variovorax sp. J2P1-59]
MEPKSWIATLKEADANRPDLPGEHLVVLGVGLLLMMASGRSRTVIGKALIGAAAGAFIGRAASGTGGLTRLTAKIDEALTRYRL